jgi:hypothetical protein
MTCLRSRSCHSSTVAPPLRALAPECDLITALRDGACVANHAGEGRLLEQFK